MRTVPTLWLGIVSATSIALGVASSPADGPLRATRTSGPEGSTPEIPAAPTRTEDRPGSPWTCVPGPERASEMDAVDGRFLRSAVRGKPSSHEFYFARAMYSDYGRGGFGFFRGDDDWLGDGGPSWSTDYPSSDHHMMVVARRLSNLDACEHERPVSLADPELRRFPFLYSLEWGRANLTDAEAAGLRSYLAAGGLLMIDDFWGSGEWENFAYQMRRVLPEREIVDIPRDHLLFRSYYTIDGEILQVPNVGNGRAVARGYERARTWERDGVEPHVRGIFDEDGRLMVVIYWNTDLGDALEWAEDPEYPLRFSTFAAQVFLNTIVYAMTQ